MENIIDKLSKVDDETPNWDTWSLEQKKQLLELYFIISKKESHIFDLIYSHHPCDSWEDFFRDYSLSHLNEKATGVEIAIQEITEEIDHHRKIEQTQSKLVLSAPHTKCQVPIVKNVPS